MKESLELVLVSCDQHPELPPDDRRLLAPLTAAGIAPRVVRWNDPDFAWESCPNVVLRAPWDYHLKLPAFFAWLDRLDAAGTRVLNPTATVRWNSDKRYLRDLASRGVDIVPTLFLEPNEAAPLAQLLEREGWDEAVLKPSVSAGSHQTVRVRRRDDTALAKAEATRAEIARRGYAAMLQPYLGEVEREGEWSFFFFDRALSHVVRKRPKAGDFRVQEEFGGITDVPKPTAEALRAAERVIAAVEGPLLYARVDAIPVSGRLLLGELELIEPALFFAHSGGGPERFVEALLRLSDPPARSR